MSKTDLEDLLALLDNSLEINNGEARVKDASRLRATIHRLAEISVLEMGSRQGLARYLTRLAALEMNIIPCSIHELYMARGRGEIPLTFSVPAINLRALSFDAACAVFRVARDIDAGAFIFEIARSEIGYTNQQPAEYATNILAGAIAEKFSGPVFIQGDHFQVSAKRYAQSPDEEIQAIRELIHEAIQAGFYNIDIDTSTLVDLDKETLDEQQALNARLSAALTNHIRSLEPKGLTISVGGEIGEVGGRNSTEQELRAYMNGYAAELEAASAEAAGLSKISIQTGTSHGGVVLPDGSIKQVNVDFETLAHLSRIAREEYGLGGAVQHGASTLPEEAFGKFVGAQACEVHLATNFQNMLYDRLPDSFKEEIYNFLDEKHAEDRKNGMTDEQFYYKTRKMALGPFKVKLWNLSPEKKNEIGEAWENQFRKLFELLGLQGTRQYVDEYISPIKIMPEVKDYQGEPPSERDIEDLQD